MGNVCVCVRLGFGVNFIIYQVSLSCEPGCDELEEFVLPASTVTSITLHVEEMCQPGEASLDQVKVIGGFADMGNINIFHFKNKITKLFWMKAGSCKLLHASEITLAITPYLRLKI